MHIDTIGKSEVKSLALLGHLPCPQKAHPLTHAAAGGIAGAEGHTQPARVLLSLHKALLKGKQASRSREQKVNFLEQLFEQSRITLVTNFTATAAGV